MRFFNVLNAIRYVEMKVAPFRALTLKAVVIISAYCVIVEMKDAPFRALILI